MAFVKTSRSDQVDQTRLEIIADAFTLTGGTPVSNATRQAAIVALTANATATAVDLPTAEALANSLQTTVNAIIAALKT
jgi:hypothetical protein